ncbi:hypothetical protein [Kitasatospora sp. NPDC057015]|uniref:hypothetical protein n=1 Tax=Kitasatospora sp. NPDC057015 TaxID=3346001 RepID=UPI0036404162
MALTDYQKQRIVSLLERESQTRISAILRSAGTLLNWVAGVVDLGYELVQQVRATAPDILQRLRSIFL